MNVSDFKLQNDRKWRKELAEIEKLSKDQEIVRQTTLAQQQEALQAETLRMESELRESTDLSVIRARSSGNSRAERENHQQHRNLIRIRAQEQRKTVLASIKTGFSTLGSGISNFLDDRERLSALVLTVSTIGLGIYTAKVATSVAGRVVESRLGKPTLVRETSRAHGFGGTFVEIFSSTVSRVGLRYRETFTRNKFTPLSQLESKKSDVSTSMEAVILDPRLEIRLKSVAQSTKNTKRNCAPFRHLLLYGPPGTGKTLFARELAKSVKLELKLIFIFFHFYLTIPFICNICVCIFLYAGILEWIMQF